MSEGASEGIGARVSVGAVRVWVVSRIVIEQRCGCERGWEGCVWVMVEIVCRVVECGRVCK